MSQPQRDRSRVSSAPSSKPGTEAAGGPRHFLAAATAAATAAAPAPRGRPTDTPRASSGRAAHAVPQLGAPSRLRVPGRLPPQNLSRMGPPAVPPSSVQGGAAPRGAGPAPSARPAPGSTPPPQPPSLSSHQSPRPLTCRARPPPGPVPFHSRPLRTIARPVAGWAWPRAHPRPRLFPPIAGRRQSSLA